MMPLYDLLIMGGKEDLRLLGSAGVGEGVDGEAGGTRLQAARPARAIANCSRIRV